MLVRDIGVARPREGPGHGPADRHHRAGHRLRRRRPPPASSTRGCGSPREARLAVVAGTHRRRARRRAGGRGAGVAACGRRTTRRRSCPASKWLPISWSTRSAPTAAARTCSARCSSVPARRSSCRSPSVVDRRRDRARRSASSAPITPRLLGESLAHLIDVLIALPTLILALVFVAALGGSVWTVSLAIGLGVGRRARPRRARRGGPRADPGLHRHGRGVRFVDVPHRVAPHHPQHRARPSSCSCR